MTALLNIFYEMDIHLTEDDQPSLYFIELSSTPIFDQYPLNLLKDLKKTNQSPKHHPEGNVWNHTMLVMDEAAKVKEQSSDKRVFMWAALLHDIGKPGTTRIRKGRITSYDHDILGAELAGRFLREFTDDEAFVAKVAAIVRWHMQILFVVKDLPFADIKAMKAQADVRDIALFGLCDRLGRLSPDRTAEKNNIKRFLEKCSI
jgi:putative nucleotidyltransferase with HDIG domain